MKKDIVYVSIDTSEKRILVAEAPLSGLKGVSLQDISQFMQEEASTLVQKLHEIDDEEVLLETLILNASMAANSGHHYAAIILSSLYYCANYDLKMSNFVINLNKEEIKVTTELLPSLRITYS